MTQGLFAGGTDYTNQSLNDIKEDILYWMGYCKTVQEEFEQTIQELSDIDYWNTKVPFNFRIFCASFIQTCETFHSDFDRVIQAIDMDNITKREITLLNNVYEVAHREERNLVSAYKEEERWKDYEVQTSTKRSHYMRMVAIFLRPYSMWEMFAIDWRII